MQSYQYLLIIIFFTVGIDYVFSCNGITLNGACCASSCGKCDQCPSNPLCCYKTILNGSACCNNNNNNPPCIICASTHSGDGGSENQYDQIVNWLESLEIYQLVLFIIGCCLVLVFLIYICCCFGNHKPPVKYEYIVGRYS